MSNSATTATLDSSAVLRWRPWHLWCLGFFLTANLYMIPSLKLSPRATDLLAVLLAIWVLVQLASRGLPRAPLAAVMLLNFLPCGWFAYAYLTGDRQTLVLSGRWLIAIPWGLALLPALADDRARRAFLYGLTCGLFANVAVVLLQAVGLDSSLRSFGFSTTDTRGHFRAYRMMRLPGLHGLHNSSASVISLIVPVTLYLYIRYRASVWLPLAGVGGLFVAVHLTSTRAPLVVGMFILVVGVLLARLPRRSLLLVVLLVVLVGGSLVVVGPPGGMLRWVDLVSTEENVSGRLLSSSKALRLSLEHPFGLGVQEGRQQLIAESAIPATHNAFLQATLFFGLATGLILLLSLLYLAWQAVRGSTTVYFLEGLLAFHLLALFLFEEHLNNPTFLILANWLVATSAALLSGDADPTAAVARPAKPAGPVETTPTRS